MPINQYTRDLIIPRQIARLDNPQAVQDAGGMARGLANVFNVGAEIAFAEEKTQFNDKMITYQKDLMDLQDQTREETMTQPDAFDSLYEKRVKQLNENYKKDFSFRTKRMFEQTSKELGLRFYQQNQSWKNDRKISMIAEDLESAQENLGVMAYRGGDIDELFRNAEASAVAAQGVLAPEKISDYKQATKASIVQNRLNMFLENGQTGAAKSLLDSGKYDEFLGGDGLSRAYKAVESKRKQTESEIKAAETKTLRQEYSNFNDAFSLGVIPSQEVVTEIKDRAISLGMEDVVRDIDMKLKTHGTVNAFVKDMPIAEQQQALASKMESLRSNPSEENVFEYKALAKAYENKITQIQSGNGMAYYESIGLIPKQEPIDVTQPDNVVQAYEQRRVAQQAILQREGVSVPLFSKAEAQGMAQFYEQLPVKDRRNYIAAMTGNLDKNDASQLAGVVAAEQPALAGILALSKENPRLAEQAIKGSMLENKISSKGDVYSRMVQTIGSAVDDPRALNSSMDVIRDAYEKALVESGKQVDDFDLLDEVIEDAFGEVISFGNSNVLPFRKDDGQFVSEGEFKNLIKRMDVDFLEKRQGSVPYLGSEPIDKETLEDAFFSWETVTVGDGLYQVRNGSDVLLDKNGAPYVFNFGELHKDIEMGGHIITNMKRGFDIISTKASEAIQPLAGE